MRWTDSSLVFTPFLVTYFLMRGYWGNMVGKRPVEENRSFALDRVNIALVAASSLLLPLLALHTSLLDWFSYPLNRIMALFSIPFLLSGLVIFWISHRDLGEYWSPTLEIKQGHSLVTNGIFRRVRHPMYLAIWLCVIGQALCVPNWFGGIGALVAWALLYFVRIEKEERMLAERFGESYREYALKTKRLIPGLY